MRKAGPTTRCTKRRLKGGYAKRKARLLTSSTSQRWRAYACPDCGSWHLTTCAVWGDSIPRPKGQLLRRSSGPRIRTLAELEAAARAKRPQRKSEKPITDPGADAMSNQEPPC